MLVAPAATMTSRQKLVIGSRGSKLALWQANWVRTCLQAPHSNLEISIEVIKTTGDMFANAPLSSIGSKGLFTREIEEALLAKKVDLAVHSLKDLPTVLPDGLRLGAISAREDARDAFVSRLYGHISQLPPGARVGTSSLRRQSQIMALRNDLKILSLRGNIDTRLRKLDESQYEAVILACAGMDRLALSDRIRERLPIDLMCPAVGQGALGIEIRSDDDGTHGLLACLHHTETQQAVTAERALLRRLGGGCQVPIAGHAWIQDGELHLRGIVATVDGSQLFQESAHSLPTAADELGISVAEKLLGRGAHQILRDFANA
jgi:hydroxymethylbilane synthase